VKRGLLRRPYLLGDFTFCLFLFCSHTCSSVLVCVRCLICLSFFGRLLLGLGLRVFHGDGLVTILKDYIAILKGLLSTLLGVSGLFLRLLFSMVVLLILPWLFVKGRFVGCSYHGPMDCECAHCGALLWFSNFTLVVC
jgi:hypothetical protein